MLEVGQTFVGGRSKENARALLEAADRAGVDRRKVKTAEGGYIVPNEVADELGEGSDAEETEGTAEVKAEPVEIAATAFNPHEASFSELRREAKRRGLSAGGTQQELAERLSEATKESE